MNAIAENRQPSWEHAHSGYIQVWVEESVILLNSLC